MKFKNYNPPPSYPRPEMPKGPPSPALPARSAAPGLPNGPESHGIAPVGLLTITFPGNMKDSELAMVDRAIAPLAQSLNLKTLVLSQGQTASIQYDLSPLIAAIQAQTQAMAALAESNQGLIRAMAEDAGDGDDGEPRGYLNAR